jgi:Adenylate cyclase, family 3 (some proteins contain HAMP domain)
MRSVLYVASVGANGFLELRGARCPFREGRRCRLLWLGTKNCPRQIAAPYHTGPPPAGLFLFPRLPLRNTVTAEGRGVETGRGTIAVTEAGRGAQRKLTTVLCADVEGYTRLMGEDEEGTFATLKAYREAIARIVTTYGGRVVNTWGDAIIAEFPSVVESVRAAIDIQTELAARNARLPEARRLVFRIGINLGDVLVDEGNIYGDGVNIAARLEAAAEPGGILISNTVYDQVRNKLAVGFEFGGDLSVKNVDESVPSFIVRVGERGAAQARASVRTASASASQSAAGSDPGAATQAGPGEPVQFGGRLAPTLGTFGVVAVVLVVINLVTSPGDFWAAWPLLALAVAAALAWTRRQTLFDRRLAGLGVICLGIVGINLLASPGDFWAIWPLLGIGVAAAMRWLKRSST